jgi:hypothetical protein
MERFRKRDLGENPLTQLIDVFGGVLGKLRPGLGNGFWPMMKL